MTKREADHAFLVERWNEQCEKFPAMRDEIPLAAYLSHNLVHAERIRDELCCVEHKAWRSKVTTW